MAARDHFSIKISCPKCGEKGVLHVSENDYPFMKKNERQIVSIESNFSAQMIDETEIKKTCLKCNEIFLQTKKMKTQEIQEIVNTAITALRDNDDSLQLFGACSSGEAPPSLSENECRHCYYETFRRRCLHQC